jgi:hypothetical protein
VKRRFLFAALGVAACSGPISDNELGRAVEGQIKSYAIAGVRASPGTVHLTGLPWLLNCAEGTGPLVVTTHVGTFVQPMMSTTVTGVSPDAVSQAVGYSLWSRHDLLAVSSASFAPFESSRLEAYASFVQTCWEVKDAASGALVGTGASFDPCGVYFQTVNASHVALPDEGIFDFLPACALPGGPVPPEGAGEGAADAGVARVPGFLPSENHPVIIGGERP